jgi:type VI secretion system protein ImpK
MSTHHTNPLLSLFSDLFVLGTTLKTASNPGDVSTLQSRILAMLGEIDQRADAGGITKDVVMDAKFAVAAFIDEMVMTSRWPEKGQWGSRLLQYELFQTQVGGVEFFDHLDGIRRRLPLNAPLLEVYYVCLLLGFRGKFALIGHEKLAGLVADLRRDLDLTYGEPPPLSPNAKRPDEARQKRQESVLPLVLSGACCGLVLLIYIVLSFMIGSSAADVAEKFGQIAQQASEDSP